MLDALPPRPRLRAAPPSTIRIAALAPRRAAGAFTHPRSAGLAAGTLAFSPRSLATATAALRSV